MLKRASLIILLLLITTSVAIAQGDVLDVLTYHNDIGRTGWYSHETTLTQQNVNPQQFGQLALLQTSDRVRTTPLYVHNITINSLTRQAVFVGDDSANVYAFDAETYNQLPLWKVNALGVNEQTTPNRGCDQVPDHMGVVATPVIDRTKGPHGAIYFVAASYNPNDQTYHHRLHALDLTTGAELFGGPVEIQATYPGNAAYGNGSYVSFEPQKYYVRAALTEVNNSIYFGFASICDGGGLENYGGWLMQYNAGTLAQQGVINFAPNDDIDPTETSRGYGAAIWASGTGFASDGTYLYIPLANGLWSGDLDGLGFPADLDYGNSFVKVEPAPPGQQYMKVRDYFTMYNAQTENAQDLDLGSGGSMVLLDIPNAPPLAIAAGKDDFAYLCRKDDMGKWNPNNNQIWQQLGLGGASLATSIYGAPAYFNNGTNRTIYWGPLQSGPGTGYLEAYTFKPDGTLPTLPNSHTITQFNYPGTTPSVSSNGGTNGIVWAVHNYSSVLYAYNASNLAELYHGVIGPNPGAHFDTPVIANGKVFVSNLVDPLSGPTGVQVFGLLH